MPLEFALRPRIKLPEGFAPPRRARFRLPKLVLPVLAYWLLASGITYGLIRAHAQPDAPVGAQALAAPPDTKPALDWWQPAPARTAAPALAHDSEPAPLPPSGTVPEQPPVVDDAPLADEPAQAAEPPFAPDNGDGALALAAREPRRKHGSNSSVSDESAPDVAPDSRVTAHDEIRAPDLFPLPSLAPEPSRNAPPPLLGATPPDAPAAIAAALPSCESAAAAANQDVDIAHRDSSPDLSRAAIATVLDNGVWIARCDIPMSSSIELCVAIKGGVVVGASVTSHPTSAAINACVKRRAAGLHFPFSSRVDIARVHF